MREIILANKHCFDWWLKDGVRVWHFNPVTIQWELKQPDWTTPGFYVQNDEYAEFRKVEALGGKLQYKSGTWAGTGEPAWHDAEFGELNYSGHIKGAENWRIKA